MSIEELRKAREQAIGEARANLEEGKDGDQEKLMAEVRRLDEEYDAAVKAEEELRSFEDKKVKPAEQRTIIQEVEEEKETDNPFKTLGDQLRAIKRHQDGMIDNRLIVKRAAGANEGTGSEGGFLVAPEFASELYKRIYETGALASRVRKFTINGNSLTIPTIDETSRADGSRWGGVQGYWTAEGATPTATQPAFGQIEMKLNKLMALCYASDELLEDTAALESVITAAFTDEMGFKLDDAIMNGTGAGMPLGVMNADCLVEVAKENGQAADTLMAENVINMWSRLYAKSRPNAVWFVNQDIESQLYTMSITVGTGGNTVFIPQGGLSGQPYSTLFGRPVIPIEQCATLGDKGDIVLADMSQYAMIEKGGMKSDSSMHVRFIYDEMAYRFILRADGTPLWKSALTPNSGSSNTLSPFVTLAERA